MLSIFTSLTVALLFVFVGSPFVGLTGDLKDSQISAHIRDDSISVVTGIFIVLFLASRRCFRYFKNGSSGKKYFGVFRYGIFLSGLLLFCAAQFFAAHAAGQDIVSRYHRGQGVATLLVGWAYLAYEWTDAALRPPR
jgi:hypothetical protein